VAAGGVGVGAITPGVVSVVLGTSGVARANQRSPDRGGGAAARLCHALPERYLMGDAERGGELRGLRHLAPGVSFDDLFAEAGGGSDRE
jgi:sugar (pentulose or hexulose) kinase